MTSPQFCPRAVENGGGPDSPMKAPFNGEMTWSEDGTCSYCGSVNPDMLMAALEAGTVELTPTDKSYKVYVDGLPNPRAGLPRIVSISNAKEAPGPNYVRFTEAEHRKLADAGGRLVSEGDWITVETEGPTRYAKFYFQHLSGEQRTRFIQLYNEKRMRLAFPGHFYVLPFFCRRAEAPGG